MESLAIRLFPRHWDGPRPAQSRTFVLSILLLGALATLAASPKAETIAPPKAAAASALDLPVYFEVNRGQIASDAVRFVARGTGHSIFLTETGADMALRQPATKEATATVHMRLEDANPTPRIVGGENLDEANDIAIDQGYAYVAGRTFSTGFPMVYPVQPTLGGMDDAFVAKVAPDGGDLAYSTYLGGNNSDFAYAIAVDDAGGAYVTGRTASATFGGATSLAADQGGGGSTTDVFVAKLGHDANQNAALAYLLFLGGGDNDVGRGIAVDGEGYAYVIGRTTSEDFPTTPGAYQGEIAGEVTKGRSYNDDAFVAKVQQDGSGLVYATYLGDGGVDVGYAIAVDAQYKAYLVGTTASTGFPTVNAVQDSLAGSSGQGKNLMEDGFITVLTADGSDLVFSSYYGGTDHDMARGIALDEGGSMYVVGRTASDDLPTVGAFDDALYGVVDAFLVKIDP